MIKLKANLKAIRLMLKTVKRYWCNEIGDRGLYAGMNEARITAGRQPVMYEGLNYDKCAKHGWQRAFAVPGLTGEKPVCNKCI